MSFVLFFPFHPVVQNHTDLFLKLKYFVFKIVKILLSVMLFSNNIKLRLARGCVAFSGASLADAAVLLASGAHAGH